MTMGVNMMAIVSFRKIADIRAEVAIMVARRSDGELVCLDPIVAMMRKKPESRKLIEMIIIEKINTRVSISSAWKAWSRLIPEAMMISTAPTRAMVALFIRRYGMSPTAMPKSDRKPKRVNMIDWIVWSSEGCFKWGTAEGRRKY